MKGENILKFIDKNIAINKTLGMVGGIDLLALRDELVEIMDKADKWDEKEAPYKPNNQEYTEIKYCEFGTEGKCKCSADIIDEYSYYCPFCGQKLDWEE